MENLKEVKQKIYNIVLNNLSNVDPEEVLDDTDLFSLNLDSMNALTLILNLQDAFGVEFGMEEISYENFRTIVDITELIKRKKEVYHGIGKD